MAQHLIIGQELRGGLGFFLSLSIALRGHFLVCWGSNSALAFQGACQVCIKTLTSSCF
jgi:hypothetical protein